MTYQEYVDQVNLELGGSYVNGVLTPPSWWTAGVTQWSRHVQEEAAKRSAGMTFTSLPPSEIEALHYGGYPPGSPEASNYVRLVEAQGWVWSYPQNTWIRADTGYIYIEPIIPIVIEPDPVTQPIDEIRQIIPNRSGTFVLGTLGLFTLGILANRSKKRKVK